MEGEEAVLNLSETVMDFLIGGAGGLVSSTPRLFDISLDAYNDKRFKSELGKETVKKGLYD